MKCSHCGSEIPRQSRFCLQCAAPVVHENPVASPRQLPDKRLGIWAMAAGLSVVALLVLLIMVGGRREKVMEPQVLPDPQQAPVAGAPMVPGRPGYPVAVAPDVPGRPQSPVTAAPGLRAGPQPSVLGRPGMANDTQAPVMQSSDTPIEPQPGVANAPEMPEQQQSPVYTPPEIPAQTQSPVVAQDQKPAPPTAVLAYLEHVRQVEAMRRTMRSDLSPAFEMLRKAYGLRFDPEDESREENLQDINLGYNAYVQRWQDIVTYFNRVRPPRGCEQLGSAYRQALTRYSSIMIDIQSAMSRGDASALYSLYGTAQADVDSSLLRANLELNEVCNNYDIPKGFSIAQDRGVDSLLSPD